MTTKVIPPKGPGTFVYLGLDPNREKEETDVWGVKFPEGVPVKVEDPDLGFKLRCLNIGKPGAPLTFKELTAEEVAALKVPAVKGVVVPAPALKPEVDESETKGSKTKGARA